jgi:hypothetical protein
MFWYFPFFIFAGAILFAFPKLAMYVAGAYVFMLIWPRVHGNPRNRPRFR